MENISRIPWLAKVLFPLSLALLGIHSEPALCEPIAACDAPLYDFGVVEKPQLLRTEFNIANEGDSPLEIVGLNADCGCTRGVIGDAVVEPGESAVIAVAFTPEGPPGVKKAHVNVSTNAPSKSSIILTVQCQYAPKVYLSSPSIHFGQVYAPEVSTARGEVFVRAADGYMPFVVSKVDLRGTRGIEVISCESISEGEYRIVVGGTPELETGRISGELVVETEPPTESPLVCNIAGTVLGKILVHPSVVSVSQGGGTAESVVRVAPGCVSSFMATKVDAPSMINCNLIERDGYYLVMVEGIPRACGEKLGEIVIHTDVTGSERISVPLLVRGCP